MDVTLILEANCYDSGNRAWDVALLGLDEQSLVQGRITNPYSDDEAKELRWYLEDYAQEDPFAISRASFVKQSLVIYAAKFCSSVQPLLVWAIALLANDMPPDTKFSCVRLFITSKKESINVHSLLWEFLEQDTEWNAQYDLPPILVSHSYSTLASTALSPATESTYNILFVSSRPDLGSDVAYRLLSKPIWELMTIHPALKSDVKMYFARPGTWAQVVHVLKAHSKGFFSLVHFDTHGDVKKDTGAGLIFSSAKSATGKEPRRARGIGKVLVKHGVQTVFLNACKSALATMKDVDNLARTLTEEGVSNVVGMAFKFNAETAPRFMSQLYQSFFIQRKDLQRSVYEGRQKLRGDSRRRSNYGTWIEIDDSHIPVLYQNHNGQIRWNPSVPVMGTPEPDYFSVATGVEHNNLENLFMASGGVVGRDIDMLQLEVAFSYKRAILLTGKPGTGKSAFKDYVMDWWRSSGFFQACIEVSLADLRDCRDKDSLYSHIADRCQLLQESFKDYKSSIHERSILIVIDNIDDIPADPNDQIIDLNSLKSFVEDFADFPSRTTPSRLLLLSRFVPDILQSLAIHQELNKFQITDALMMSREELSDHQIAFLELPSNHGILRNLLDYHENNCLFIKTILPHLKFDDSLSRSLKMGLMIPQQLSPFEYFDAFEGWQDQGPGIEALSLGNSHANTLIEGSQGSSAKLSGSELDNPHKVWRPKLFVDFFELWDNLKTRSQLSFTILVSLAPFQKTIRQMPFARLAGMISKTSFGDQEPEEIADIAMDLLRELEGIDLIDDNGDEMKIHICLPYLLHFILAKEALNARRPTLDEVQYNFLDVYNTHIGQNSESESEILTEIGRDEANFRFALLHALQLMEAGHEVPEHFDLLSYTAFIANKADSANSSERQGLLLLTAHIFSSCQKILLEADFSPASRRSMERVLFICAIHIIIVHIRLLNLNLFESVVADNMVLVDDIHAQVMQGKALLKRAPEQVFSKSDLETLYRAISFMDMKINFEILAEERHQRFKKKLKASPAEDTNEGILLLYRKCKPFLWNAYRYDFEVCRKFEPPVELAQLQAQIREGMPASMRKILEASEAMGINQLTAMAQRTEFLNLKKKKFSSLACLQESLSHHVVQFSDGSDLKKKLIKLQEEAHADGNSRLEYFCWTEMFREVEKDHEYEAALKCHQRLSSIEQEGAYRSVDSLATSRSIALREYQLGCILEKNLHDVESEADSRIAEHFRRAIETFQNHDANDMLATTIWMVSASHLMLADLSPAIRIAGIPSLMNGKEQPSDASGEIALYKDLARRIYSSASWNPYLSEMAAKLEEKNEPTDFLAYRTDIWLVYLLLQWMQFQFMPNSYKEGIEESLARLCNQPVEAIRIMLDICATRIERTTSTEVSGTSDQEEFDSKLAPKFEKVMDWAFESKTDPLIEEAQYIMFADRSHLPARTLKFWIQDTHTLSWSLTNETLGHNLIDWRCRWLSEWLLIFPDLEERKKFRIYPYSYQSSIV